MKYPHLIALGAVLLTTCGVGAAQTSDKCQLVSVEVPVKEVDAGNSIVFKAKFNTIVPTAKPEFKWEITAGTITKGEGTPSITVDTTGLGGQSIEATVSVSGVSTICSMSATQTVAVVQGGVGCQMPFDQFGDINFEDEKARLDNFAIQLTDFKQAVGSVIVLAGRQTYENEAVDRLKRAKDYLVKVRNIAPDRVVTVDAGYREEFTVYLYIIPPGATPPSVEADLSPTELELTKPRPKVPVKKRS